MNRRQVLAGAAAGATTGALRGIGSAQTEPHLAVGTAALDSGITPYVGVRAGIFKRHGLDVDVQQLNSGAALAAAVVGGTLQVGASNVMGIITAHAHGIPLQIVAPGSIYQSVKPDDLLIVRKDSPITKASDLNGKVIGASALGDLNSTATFAWMDQNGGDSKSVHVIELPLSAAPAALEAGRIDAANFLEPRLSELLRTGNVRVLAKAYDAIGKRFLVSCFVATSDYAAANRDTIALYAQAQCEANAFANAHPDQTAPWLAEFAKIDVQEVLDSKREVFAESIRTSDLQVIIDAAARYKVIDHAFDAHDLISPAVLSLHS